MANKGKEKNNNNTKKNTKSVKKNTKAVKKIEEKQDDFTSNISSKVFAIIGIAIFFCIFYLITIYITDQNKEKTDEDTDTEVTISYKNIIAGRSFDMGEGDYLVIYYDTNDEDISSKVSEAMSEYEAKEDKLSIYVVDLHDSINTRYKSDESNTHPNNASEIKIKDTTVIKFSNKEVSEYIEGTDSVVEYLK